MLTIEIGVAMRFREVFGMALQALRVNRLRSGLTLLGITVGVFAIITSVTAVKVIDIYVQDALRHLGSSIFTLQRLPMVEVVDAELEKRPPITYAQLQRLQQRVPPSLAISPETFFGVISLRYKQQKTEPNLFVIGSNQHYAQNFGFEIVEGRAFTEAEVHHGRLVALLGADVAKELFPNENPTGKHVRVSGQRFRIVGVLSRRGSFLGFSRDNLVVAPISTLFGLYGRKERDLQRITVRTGSAQTLPAAMEEVIGKMRVIRKVQPGQENNFELIPNDAIRESFALFAGMLSLGGALIGFISLVAAGVGVMNIMLVAVTERTREIGICKAVGARRKHLLWQFLLEALFLCQIGAVVGIVAGVLFGNGVAWYFDLRLAFPVGWAVGAIVLVAMVAVVFGAYPAYKAAGLNPIETLRYA